MSACEMCEKVCERITNYEKGRVRFVFMSAVREDAQCKRTTQELDDLGISTTGLGELRNTMTLVVHEDTHAKFSCITTPDGSTMAERDKTKMWARLLLRLKGMKSGSAHTMVVSEGSRTIVVDFYDPVYETQADREAQRMYPIGAPTL